jgi:hypothetical protein
MLLRQALRVKVSASPGPLWPWPVVPDRFASIAASRDSAFWRRSHAFVSPWPLDIIRRLRASSPAGQAASVRPLSIRLSPSSRFTATMRSGSAILGHQAFFGACPPAARRGPAASSPAIRSRISPANVPRSSRSAASFQRQMWLTLIPGRRWASVHRGARGRHRATRRPPERRTRALEATARDCF